MSCEDDEPPREKPPPPKVPVESKQYDVTPEEREVIEFRAARRQALRNYFLKEKWDPLNHHGGGGHVFDPAVLRHQARSVNQYDHFKPTFKAARMGFFLLIFPYAIFTYLVHRDRSIREAQIRRGEVAYKDRQFKYI